MPISLRILYQCHSVIVLLIIKKFFRLFNNFIAIYSHKLNSTSLHGLRSFRCIPGNQYRLAK
jgi:hypothetical protein